MHGDDDGGVLLKREATSSTYELLLRKAQEEGRVGGRYVCTVCGMKYKDEQAATACCEHFLKTSH